MGEIKNEEKTEMEKQIQAHNVPNRTQKIGYYMNLFKEFDQEYDCDPSKSFILSLKQV